MKSSEKANVYLQNVLIMIMITIIRSQRNGTFELEGDVWEVLTLCVCANETAEVAHAYLATHGEGSGAVFNVSLTNNWSACYAFSAADAKN